MNTCHVSLLFVSKTPFWGLIVASTDFEARAAVRVAEPEDASAAMRAAVLRLSTLSRRNSLSLYANIRRRVLLTINLDGNPYHKMTSVQELVNINSNVLINLFSTQKMITL
jgi:hypothetical protein